VFDEGCNTTPLITPEAVVRMEALVADALEKGATLVAGGKRPADMTKGNYFLPTVLTNVTTDMRVFREEIFGPILAIMAYDDLDEAIALGNDTEYGLYATPGPRYRRGQQDRPRPQVRSVSINGGGGGIHVPHGGVKESASARTAASTAWTSITTSSRSASRWCRGRIVVW
jgi:acyl-CoA reductase-like NAD-dependent aldehyde dehydrogenase